MRIAVLQYLTEHSPARTLDIAREVAGRHGWAESSVRSLISRMCHDSEIYQVRRGIFSIDESASEAEATKVGGPTRKSRHVADLGQWIGEEIVALWRDLEIAHQYARNDEWSIQCEDIGERIQVATALVGPVDWNRIGLSLVTSGWFAWANQKIGVAGARLPTEAEMDELHWREGHPTSVGGYDNHYRIVHPPGPEWQR